MKHVLFVGSGVAGISSMAEAILNHFAEGKFQAYAAGFQSGELINPFALEQIKTLGYPAKQLQAKSLFDFLNPNEPKIDIVIMVCSQEQQALPVWPGNPIFVSWPLEDLGTLPDSTQEIQKAFASLFIRIQLRVKAFLAISPESLDPRLYRKLLNTIHTVAD